MTWMTQAACAKAVRGGYADPEDWFPHDREISLRALDICNECPVAAECWTFSQTLGSRHTVYGIWGGITRAERNAS